MKKITARIFTAILLALGLLSASSIVLPANSGLVTNAYADLVPVPNNPDTIPADGNDENTDNNTNDVDNTNDTDTTDDENDQTDGTKDDESENENDNATKNTCEEQVGSLSWIVCPSGSVVAGATDALYNAIGDMLVVNPISMGNNSPIYLVWKYLRSLTNIIFIICLLVVIYSQLTGLGIQNYGIKRILPRLIVSVILVNLSFLICALAVDLSNVIGNSLRGTFEGIGNEILSHAEAGEAVRNFNLSEFLTTVLAGGVVAGLGISTLGGGGYLFFMLLIVLVGALVAVISGLITIAARQALVALLIMISPLAFVAYLLPNTEKWFEKWKDLLFRMLIFYPMFSFLFGASELVGYALILAAKTAPGIVLGVAVQFFPLISAWSLMKMSGTVLESINRGVRKIASPIQHGLAGWSASHAEQNRQNHIAHSTMPGAKLRRYLDYRQSLRELDTKNSLDARQNRALEATYKTASSSRGHDENGLLTWDPVANRYTQNAKIASLYQTRASTAESAYRNTLTAYGRTFSGSNVAQRLSNAHAEAYKDNMAQQFLTANEAQADQDYLLGQYLSAQNNQFKDPYEFNRLVKSAAGSLGHTGESSIMGQVIIGNATTEGRRRTEARVMIAKFGIDKPGFRGMVFDTEHMNDNGIETDANGKEIQDDQYNMKDGYEHTPWQHYIARDRDTGEEITKEEYDNLDAAKRSQYTKVKYFDITDDSGKVVQRVYDDDAGYMKEILNDDIAIGDPINDRYLTEIGVAHAKGERTGILRKYHSTITGALNSTGYNEHNAADSAMVTSQSNLGYITSAAQLSIAQLQSINVAVKPGKFLQNDARFIDKWRRIVCATYGLTGPNGEAPEDFSYFFPDDELYNYRNVNSADLPGLKLEDVKDENGEVIGKKWTEIPAEELKKMTYDEVVEARKNCLKHKIIPKSIARLIGTTNRDFTPNIMDSQKPATLKALQDLVTTLISADDLNNDTDQAFENRPNGNDNLMTKADRKALTNIYKATSQHDDRGGKGGGGEGGADSTGGASGAPGSPAYDYYDDGYYDDGYSYDDFDHNNNSNNPPVNNGSGNTKSGNNSSHTPRNSGASGSAPRNVSGSGRRKSSHQPIIDRLERGRRVQEQYDQRNDIDDIIVRVEELLDPVYEIDFDGVRESIIDMFNETEVLQGWVNSCENIFDNYARDLPNGIVRDEEYYRKERAVLEQVKGEIINLLYAISSTLDK